MLQQTLHTRHDTSPDGAAGGIMADGVTVTYRNGHTALYDATFEIPQIGRAHV